MAISFLILNSVGIIIYFKRPLSYRCLVGGSSSRAAMTKKAILPRDVRTYGIDRTDESDDLVDRE